MIVIGVDVHKHSLTAVAVDEAGRQLEQLQLEYGRALFAWAGKLGEDRLWAVEDCRQVTRALERQLVAAGEELVRVPPKLTGPLGVPGGRVGSRTRSTRWRSHESRCASRTWIGLVPVRSDIGISSCWSITATISSTSAAAASNGCAGICISSTPATGCPPARWTERSGSTASAAGSSAGQQKSRCASHATSSRAAAS